MRLLALILISLILSQNLFANQKIKEQEKNLQNISKERDNISKKLKILGNDINAKNSKIQQLDKDISRIGQSIESNQKLYLQEEEVYKNLQTRKQQIVAKNDTLRKELVDTILKDMAILMILNSPEALDEASIMSEEVLKQMSEKAKERVNNLYAQQQKLGDEMKQIENRINSAKNTILTQEKKRDKLKNTKEEQQNLTKKMQKELDAYNKELVRLDKERDSIKQVLLELNIIKKKESGVIDSSSASGKILPPLEVRQIGSSYKPARTAKYNGAKTNAPLREYKIETKYGQHIDPVYKMKVFNEFITFGVKKRSPVTSVLEGKVVFAKDTSFAKKMLVIEHKNGLHTIYSYLDNIHQNIKVGTKVKKGTILAYVNDKLNFEVTLKDKHINPLDLIKVK